MKVSCERQQNNSSQLNIKNEPIDISNETGQFPDMFLAK